MNYYMELAEREGQPRSIEKVRKWVEIILDTKLSLGERMLVRQTVARCFDDLKVIEHNRNAFDVNTEAFTRFLMHYRGVPANVGYDFTIGWADQEKLRALREREPRQDY
ncbi:MAG: hypothetical protein Q7R87_03030 [Nanoarchaeota archaeon]|nr:hypothetical protein [Nanoarchaeota archaeon]